MAEREGFEPPGPCGPAVFKTAAIDHSATSPTRKDGDGPDQGGSKSEIRATYAMREGAKRLHTTAAANWAIDSHSRRDMPSKSPLPLKDASLGPS